MMRIGVCTDVAHAFGAEHRYVGDTTVAKATVIVESQAFRRHAGHLRDRLFQREHFLVADVLA
jgi:hypothetical protein